MNILGIIPARKNSKGVLNKNIKIINGNPLIFYTIEKAKKSKLITDLVVSSDSNLIKKISKKSKIKNFSLRPSKLATDKSTIDKTIKYELNRMEKIKKRKYELIVLLQPTSPLRKGEIIDNSINLFIKKYKKYSSLISISKIEEPNPFKALIFKKRKLKKLINYNTNTDTSRRQDYPKTFIPNGIIYIFKRKLIKDSKKILGNNILGYEVKDEYINIDTNRDLLISKILLK
tara:strand:+ start:1838 stop:2530 length:693 start_codon:yes stop_codon:yes gene_type:complete